MIDALMIIAVVDVGCLAARMCAHTRIRSSCVACGPEHFHLWLAALFLAIAEIFIHL